MFEKLNTKERLIKARIQIQRSNPFFAYLSLYLKFNEVPEGKDGELQDFGMGVDVQGNLYYKPSFVNKQNDRQLMGVMVHEILHLSFMHLQREGTRNHQLFNIANDICVNNVLTNNGYDLPKGGIIPYNNKVEIPTEKGPISVVDINKKMSEQVYDELLKQLEKKFGKGCVGKNIFPEGFDMHIKATGKDGKPLTDKEKRELQKIWQDRTNEAAATAKMRGTMPAGMELLLGKLHESKVNWRTLLERMVQSYIPYDYSYGSCSKKSISSGVYMPNSVKERIKVLIAIDTSGSIGQKELTDFLSEIVGMARAYQNRIEMILLTHDTEVHNDYKIENGSIAKILQLKIQGGGGTAHQPVFEYIKQKHRDTEVGLFFTDGYSDLNEFDMNPYRFNKIFVLSTNATDNQLKGKKAKVIQLTD